MGFLTSLASPKLRALTVIMTAINVGSASSNYTYNYDLPLTLETFSSTISNTTSNVQWLSSKKLDAPKVIPMNDTTFQNWWFDVISPDAASSVVFNFFTSPTGASSLLSSGDSATSVAIVCRLPNGTTVTEYLSASAAVIVSAGLLGEAAAGTWIGTGASFEGTPSLKDYYIEIDTTNVSSASFEVKGSLHFRSIAPAHYACSNNLADDQDMRIFPHVGWANAMPGASVSGRLYVAGHTFNFNNVLGYHDMNWADLPFTEVIQSWYWGHFTLGPYAVVLYDGVSSSDGNEYANAYVANNEQELVSACGIGTATVRDAYGTWPSRLGTPLATTLNISIPLSTGGSLNAIATVTEINEETDDAFMRGLFNISGIVGSRTYSGIGMFEQFRLS